MTFEIQVLEITGISLIDVSNNTVVKTLKDNDIIKLEDFGDNPFNIRAETSPEKVGSVQFFLGGDQNSVVIENTPPYDLFGDAGGRLAPGKYRLLAVPHSEADAQGTFTPGTPINFEVVDVVPKIGSFTLRVFDDRFSVPSQIIPLQDGDIFELSDFGIDPVNIRANPITESNIGSVKFTLTGPKSFTRIENTSTYDLFGDQADSLPPGMYTLEAIPYTQNDAKGSMGEGLSIGFEILPYKTCEGDVVLSTQEEVDNFDCNELIGNLTIEGNAVLSLISLNKLRRVTGNLRIEKTSVRLLDGLDNLDFVGGDFDIRDNDKLSNLLSASTETGFSFKFERIYGNLSILFNNELFTLAALSRIKIVDGFLDVIGNSDLQDLYGLRNLEEVRTQGSSQGIALQVANNLTLNAISFKKLRRVEGLFNISGNGSLRFVEEFESFQTLNGDFELSTNPRLGDELCCIFVPVVLKANQVIIDNNGSGCNSVEDILATCDALRVTDFELVDVANESVISTIEDGTEISVSDLENLILNIRANTNPSEVGSVRIKVTGPQTVLRTENTIPYDIFGDEGGQLLPGTYTLEATPFSKARGNGITGPTKEISFTLIDESAELPSITRFELIDVKNQELITVIEDDAVIDITDYQDRLLNIRAITTPERVGSVQLFINILPGGIPKIENVAPYDIFGDDGGILTSGNYNLFAVPYSSSGAQGVAGQRLSISFELINNKVCEGDIVLTTQEEVNNFDCREVIGNLTIEGNDITSIASLINLRKVHGNLRVQRTSVEFLDGLNNLEYLGGNFYIRFNGKLLSLLSILREIPVSEFAFPLDTIHGSISILSNDNLDAIDAFTNVKIVEGFVEILSCDNLFNLGIGFKNLEEIQAIKNSPVGIALLFFGNTRLTSIAGMNRLRHVGADLILNANRILTNISGLSNIETLQGGLIITGNALSDCCPIAHLIERATGEITIEENQLGCSSIEEINANCDILGPLSVERLDLINNNTGEVIAELTEGIKVDLTQLGDTPVNIRAVTTPDKVGSVGFGNITPSVFENIAPL